MKLEFGKEIPENFLIPDLKLSCSESCVDTFRINLKNQSAKIIVGEIEYKAWDSNNQGDMCVWNSKNKYAICLDQQAEYKLFMILLKFAHQVGELDNIFSPQKGNLYNMLQQYSGVSGGSYLGVLDEVLVNINYNFNEWGTDDINPFFIFKGPHGSRDKYYIFHDSKLGELVLYHPQSRFGDEEEFRIGRSEIIHYLQSLVLAGTQYAGRTPPQRYRELIDFIFSEKFKDEFGDYL